jgi:hypothetical protein
MALAPRAPRPGGIDMRALWRLTGWGAAAALALGVLAVTTQTYTGSQRLELALAPSEMPVRKVTVQKVPPPAPPANIAEIARLQAEVNVLLADRDRLATRVASLERNLEDLTGSIRHLSAPPAAVPAPAPKAAEPVAAAEPPPRRVEPAATAAPPPKPAAPETVAATAAPPADASHQPGAAKSGEPAAPPTESAEAAPGAAAAVPMPPERIAALPPKPEFGIALAGASNVALLHMQWAAIKANFGPLIGDLKPHALHDRRGNVSHYRLIIGPLPTYTAAAKLCSRLIAARAVCRPVKMAGEPL